MDIRHIRESRLWMRTARIFQKQLGKRAIKTIATGVLKRCYIDFHPLWTIKPKEMPACLPPRKPVNNQVKPAF